MKRWLVALLMLTALAAGAAPIVTPPEHRRGEDQTFLTFPEWYLVHSPAELAQFLNAQRAPSEFPWGGHIGQFWQGYRAVTHETRDYPFNGGYHVMVSVIGGSTTVEYGLRAAYESTVGRLAEATSDGSRRPKTNSARALRRPMSISSASTRGTCSTSSRRCARCGPTRPCSATTCCANGSAALRCPPSTSSRPAMRG